MDDPEQLRRRARRWRKIAREYDEGTARALIEAAQALEDHAAALEAQPREAPQGRRAGTTVRLGGTAAAARRHRGARLAVIRLSSHRPFPEPAAAGILSPSMTWRV
jgi:hypothetical protein